MNIIIIHFFPIIYNIHINFVYILFILTPFSSIPGNWVNRVLAKTGTIVDNGFHGIYVNAKINAGSRIAELMQYFINSNGSNEAFPDLSSRIRYFKEQEGVKIMTQILANVMDEIKRDGKMDGKREMIRKMLSMNFAISEIARIAEMPEEEIKKIANDEVSLV